MGESSTENRHPVAPFLAKCYEMVDDQTTDSIISWSPTDSSSFVIWDVNSLQQDLLPKYYNHGNFSSFMRQLNTYGFRKCDPDRWEFINEGFVKGQKHLLRNISRRKPLKSQQQRQSQKKNKSAGTLAQQTHLQQNNNTSGTIAQQKHLPQNNLSVGTRVEVGNFRPWEEVESLKKDRNLLMHEYMKLSQHQENSDNKLLRLRQRLKGMELNQQQMLSLLTMAVQSPGFLVQLLQQNESSWCVPEPSKTDSLPALQHGTSSGGPLVSDNQIVMYQPLRNEIPKPLLMPISSTEEEAQQLDEYPNGLDELFMNIDVMSLAEGVSVSMEEDMPSGNDDVFVCPEWPEDCISDLDKLLASPLSETNESSRGCGKRSQAKSH